LAFDEGPSPEGPAQPSQQDFTVSWTGLVSRTFTLWGRKLAQYIAIVGVPIIIIGGIEAVTIWYFLGLSGLISYGAAPTSPFSLIVELIGYSGLTTYLVAQLGVSIISMVVFAFVAGACIKLALDNYGTPDRGTVGESMSVAVGKIGPLIVVQLVTSGILILLELPGLLAMGSVILIDPTDIYAIQSALSALLLAVVLLYAGLIIGLYVTVRLAVAPALVVAEDKSAIGALKQSFSMASGQFWHIFAGQILLGIVVGVITLVISAFGIAFALTGALTTVIIVVVVLALIVQLFTSPLNYIFGAVLYRDLTSRATIAGQEWW
jgi:hypothetical protein